MKPTDFYKKTYLDKTLRFEAYKHGRRQNLLTQFYNSSKLDYQLASLLGNLQSPSANDIAMQQLASVKNYKIIDKELAEFVNNLTEDEVTSLDGTMTSSEVMEIFENVFQNVTHNLDVTKDNRHNTANFLIEEFQYTKQAELRYRDVLQNLEKILDILKGSNTAFVGAKELINAKQKVELGIQNINSILNTHNYPNSNLQTIFGTDNRIATSKKSALSQLYNISNLLKGREHEWEAYNTVNKAAKISNFRVADTANWYINGAKNYADLIVMDKSIKFSCIIGNKEYTDITLDEFKKIYSKDVTMQVRVTDDEWKKLCDQQRVLMIQSKSGVLQNPFNKKTITLTQIIDGETNKYEKALAALMAWYNKSKELAEISGSQIEGSHGLVYASSASSTGTRAYEALANYLLSKSLSKLIDPHLKVLIMRGKIYSVEDYLMEMWTTYKRFIRLTTPVDLSRPDQSMSIGVSDKDASYRRY